MRHDNFDLTNYSIRAEYFKKVDGRPSDELMLETILERIKYFIQQNFSIGYVFISEQLLYPIWDQFEDQHQYIGHQLPKLIVEHGLPLKNVGYDGKSRALYKIIKH